MFAVFIDTIQLMKNTKRDMFTHKKHTSRYNVVIVVVVIVIVVVGGEQKAKK